MGGARIKDKEGKERLSKGILHERRSLPDDVLFNANVTLITQGFYQ